MAKGMPYAAVAAAGIAPAGTAPAFHKWPAAAAAAMEGIHMAAAIAAEEGSI